ncbi:hypothetical protein V2I01_32575 [Micromonospora sp. BRA006-A]|nr:hypothetical protein [Micromonospora sp. BRA006-A]
MNLRVGPGEVVGVLAYDPADAEALVALLSGRVPPDARRGRCRSTACPPTTCTSTRCGAPCSSSRTT